MSAVTTHILDISQGKPAAGVPVELELLSEDGEWKMLGRGKTDDDGRLGDLLAPEAKLHEATYRLTFATSEYFAKLEVPAFYPHVSIAFQIDNADEHYHVPLLLSPFGFSTYRGS